MADIYFSGSLTYSTQQTPNVNSITYNDNSSETVDFHVIPDTTYTYTVTITDAYGDVHVHEAAPGFPDFTGNDYYGVLTGFSNGGDFTVQNYTVGAGASDYFVWLFTSAEDDTGMVTLYSDARAGTFVAPVCFVEGTRILTDRGEIAVENLAVGDLVVTASGDIRPIRWLGHRTIDCAGHLEPRSVWPVRVSAHAFGENRPSRDLLVSPGHALCVTCVDQVLILAGQLLNGITIVQERVERVTYWHVELDSHDILIANGMPAESYLEMGNRRFFVEGHTVDLHALPDGPVMTRDDYCRPFVDSGPVLEAVHQQLVARTERMGWTRHASFVCHVMADEQKLQPQRHGNTLAFQLPSSAKDVRLISDSFVPNDMDGRGDRRVLGLNLLGLSVSNGSERRFVAVDDARLATGFYPAERDGEKLWRWTCGEAQLPSSLWADLDGVVEVRIDLGCSPLRGWKRVDGVIERQPPQLMVG
jgi:hypothetical protein